MKQILQNLKTGKTSINDIPVPENISKHILIETSKTLLSVGTEKMLVDFGKASLMEKARSQPEKVKQVIEKIGTDGVMPTIDAVLSKLDQPLALGYCNVGVVVDSDDSRFKPGDRVASNGNHAEYVRVPANLCAKVPDNVDDHNAVFTVLSSISLQGIRLVNPLLGECVVVTGLGLIGLIAVQILIANGCKVIAIDLDSDKCDIARKYGAEIIDLSKDEDPIKKANEYTKGIGVDAVIIAASSKSNDIVSQAAAMCRKRGRIVLIGVVGLDLSRNDFYEKELTFQVSCSYGPGRYDKGYEENGNDYPIGFVRWTEQRNFESILDMMSSRSLVMDDLISSTFDISKAEEAYDQIYNQKSLGILINYNSLISPNSKKIQRHIELDKNSNIKTNEINCAFIGGGNYASRTLIPIFKKNKCSLDTLVTSAGISAFHQGTKFKFNNIATNYSEVLSDKNINTVIIATQHNLHAKQVIEFLEAGKNIFVEKPLALTLEELQNISEAYYKNSNLKLMVGFNRRFAPNIKKLQQLLKPISEPKAIIMTMNAGAIDKDHWVQDLKIGGGRIVGEACHYIDLMRYLVGSPIKDFQVTSLGNHQEKNFVQDKVSISIKFHDGSIGTIHYFANGGKSFSKERIEVFANDGVLQLDNFKSLKGYGWKGFKKQRLISQDKGQAACIKSFLESIKNDDQPPIPFDEIVEISKISIEVSDAILRLSN